LVVQAGFDPRRAVRMAQIQRAAQEEGLGHPATKGGL
jgi:hypothetical protein